MSLSSTQNDLPGRTRKTREYRRYRRMFANRQSTGRKRFSFETAQHRRAQIEKSPTTTTTMDSSPSALLHRRQSSGLSMFSSPIITVRKMVSSISQSDEEGNNTAAITITPTTTTTSPLSAGMERKGVAATWRSRGSKILSMLGAINNNVIVNEHARIQELVQILNDEDKIKELMAHLLATDNDAAVRIRFVRYVTQYELETNPVERKRKLAGLVDLFLSETAKCRMDELPTGLLNDASRAKLFIMNQLIDHHQVLDTKPEY